MGSGGKNMGKGADMDVSVACACTLRICWTKAKCAY